jgi:hypothetical protein
MDKLKRKRQPQETPKGLLAVLRVPAVEFLSPLTLAECLRRIEIKDRSAMNSPTRFEADVWQVSADSYKFRLRRAIVNMDYRNREQVTRVRVSGTLEFWDEHSTLVTCKADMGFHPGYIFVLLALYLLGVFIYSAVQSPGDVSALMLPLVGLPVLGIGAYIVWLGIAIEHRKLVMLVEDMLRDPVLP